MMSLAQALPVLLTLPTNYFNLTALWTNDISGLHSGLFSLQSQSSSSNNSQPLTTTNFKYYNIPQLITENAINLLRALSTLIFEKTKVQNIYSKFVLLKWLKTSSPCISVESYSTCCLFSRINLFFIQSRAKEMCHNTRTS